MSDRPVIDTGEPARGVAHGVPGAGDTAPYESIDPGIRRKIDEHLARSPGGPERLIPLLHLAQEELGYLPGAVQEQIAERLGLPLAQLHGVVSFYNFFNTTPRGKHRLKVCMGTACFVRRARDLTEAIKQVLGVDPGSVTKDGLFGLEEVRCLGSCGLAPVMTVDDDTHGNLAPGEARNLLFELQARARRERILERSEESDG